MSRDFMDSPPWDARWGLSTRARNCLWNQEPSRILERRRNWQAPKPVDDLPIETWADVVAMSDADLLKFKNLGRGTLDEIRTVQRRLVSGAGATLVPLAQPEEKPIDGVVEQCQMLLRWAASGELRALAFAGAFRHGPGDVKAVRGWHLPDATNGHGMVVLGALVCTQANLAEWLNEEAEEVE